jgi:hypothetical protein
MMALGSNSSGELWTTTFAGGAMVSRMNVREATPADSDCIREIAERSFQSSFALSPEEIATLVEAEPTVKLFSPMSDETLLQPSFLGVFACVAIYDASIRPFAFLS